MNKCNCFNENLNRVKEHIESNLPENAMEFNAEWDGHSFFVSGDYSPVNPKINYSYRKLKVNGEPAKSITKDSISMLASYCCYCGRELDKNGDSDAK